MPLHHLVYRCPLCGQDPTEVTENDVTCNRCKAVFRRGAGAAIEVRVPGQPVQLRDAVEVVDTIAEWDEREPTARKNGKLDYAANVAFRRSTGQGIIHQKGGVFGFYEKLEPEVEGRLSLQESGLTLFVGAEAAFEWPWERLSAVQTSSKTLQINTSGDRLFSFRFLDDSPRRWERLLHEALEAHYAAKGQKIREFQPRIATR
jgi:hypothetical protein